MKVGDRHDGAWVLAIRPGKGWEARTVDGRRVWVDDPDVTDDENPSPPPVVTAAPQTRTTAVKAPKR